MKTLLLTLALIACGQQQTSPTSATVTTVTDTTVATDTGSFAKLVGNKTEISCTKNNQSQIIYVSKEKTFYFCDTTMDWTAIDLPEAVPGPVGATGAAGVAGANGKDGTNGAAGTDGKNGVDGVAGINGADGINGKDGVAGTDGKNGKDGKDGTNGIAGTNGTNGTNGKDGTNTITWTDPVTGTKWTILGWLQENSISFCQEHTNDINGKFINGWLIPTKDQALEAYKDGIFNIAGIPDTMKVTPDSNFGYILDSNTGKIVTTLSESNKMIGAFCVYNP